MFACFEWCNNEDEDAFFHMHRSCQVKMKVAVPSAASSPPPPPPSPQRPTLPSNDVKPTVGSSCSCCSSFDLSRLTSPTTTPTTTRRTSTSLACRQERPTSRFDRNWRCQRLPVTESISRTSLSTRRLCLFTFLLYASAGATTATATAALAQAQSVDQFYELSKNGIESFMQSDQPGKGNSKAGASLVVVSGQKASLTCPLLSTSLSSNKLLPSSSASLSTTQTTILVKWLKESTALPYDHRHHIQANGSLVITSAQKRLDEGSYFCSLSQAQDDSLKNSAIVTLRVIDPPRVGPFEFPADLQVGMRARAMCAVSQGDAPFRFSWTQDGRSIESDVPTSESGALFRTQHFRDYSLLTVDTLTLAHAGNITCLVGNDAAKTSQSAMLKVNAPPQWLVEPRDTQVVLHQSVRVDCLASGSPKPFTTWKRATGGSPWEYVPIYNSVHYYLHPNGSLSIMAATQAQAGPFICQSTNGYGADIGKLVHIKVNEPPRFSVQSQSQTAQKDQTVRLLCQPEGDRPIRMEWSLLNGTLLNEMLLNLGDNHRAVTSSSDDEESGAFPFEIKEVPLETVNEETNNIDDNETTGAGGSSSGEGKTMSAVNTNSLVSVLTIRKPNREDSRVYVCKASNDFGWAELKIRLSVKERPDVPEEFSVLNVTESSAEIRWREPFNGNAVIVNYVVEYRVMDIDPASSATLPAAASAAVSVSAASSVSSSSSSSSVSSTTIAIDRVTTNGSLRSTIVSGLRPSTFYNIRIAATNSIGQGDFTAWTRLRTEQSAPESPPLEVHATATGPNSVKITWKSPKKSTWNGEISGFYIGYRAANSDTDLYKTVENSEENSGGKFESHITNLHRSTLYEAWVQAFNARGTGPRSELATVRTLADVPPSAPLLRLHSSTTDSITISWSPAAFGSRSSNDLTLYYRPYQPSNEHSTVNGGTVLRNAASNSPPNTWRDISILEPNGRHSVSGLECGRAYEFFATAHNSVGKSEPSTPLVARTRGDAPSPPPRGDLLTEVGAHGAIINLLNWKNNDCQISHFSIRYRPKPSGSGSSSQPWSVLAVHHSPRDNFVLRKLSSNTAYEIEVTAHSSAGSTQVIHHFVTGNVTSSGETFFNKMGFDSKVSYPMPSSTSEISFSDYEILLPVISSLIVVVVIVAVACFLCSRDHHSLFLQPGLHSRQRQPSSEKQVPFQQQEMSILKELVRSSSVTMDSHADSVMVSGAHHSEEYSCLNGLTGEPASLANSDHLNHHHLLNSPHHGNAKKDMVELQSFYHHHFHHAHNSSENASKTTRPPNSGNYALPYDVLPVSRENSNVAIYGQRPVTTVNAQSQSAPISQQPAVVEPLYATTKPVANYNHYCQKLDDSQSSDSSSNRNNSSSRANYESLVPIVCLEPRR